MLALVIMISLVIVAGVGTIVYLISRENSFVGF